MTHLTRDPRLAIDAAVAARRFTAVAVTDATTTAAATRRGDAPITQSADASAPERQAPFGLWISVALREGDGAAASAWNAGRINRDRNSPVLPDPKGIDAEIMRWVQGRLDLSRTLVLHDVDRADADSLRALAMVARSLHDKPAVLILEIDGPPGPRIKHLLRQLADHVGLLIADDLRFAAGHEVDRVVGDQKRVTVNEAVGLCRRGAYEAGTSALIHALADGSSCDDPDAWLCLAQAMLHEGRNHRLAEIAGRRSLVYANGPAARLARRTLILALQGSGRADELQRLGRAAYADLAAGDLAPGERAWLLLDAALSLRLDTHWHRHVQHLNEVLDLPEEDASPEATAAAAVWRASAHVHEGRLEQVASDQAVAIGLLEEAGDFGRPVLIRSRRGDVLASLGHSREAASELARAGRDAAAEGELMLAAVCHASAAAAYAAVRELDAAQAQLQDSTPLGRRIWSDQMASLLRRRAAGEIACATGQPRRAAEAATEVLVGTDALPASQLRSRVRAEANLLAARAAAYEDPSAAHDHLLAAKREAAGAGQAERWLLRAAARRTLASLSASSVRSTRLAVAGLTDT